ncbi:MAG: cyclopropane fatty acyl phospholipid synthase [bacterium]|nr:cyclopropane fatty acyl phospholipid synthase [bacterium]
MNSNKYKLLAEKYLNKAGVEINGSRPWDLRVNNEAFFQRVLSQGSLGLGESYMDGWWDCEKVDEFIFRLVRTQLQKNFGFNWTVLRAYLQSKLFNLQTISRSKQVAYRHYDLSNELYRHMLDDTMTYSCGYWKEARTLQEAQEAKLDLVCRKIGLKAGMRVLEIGCGFGSFMKFAAEKYGAKVTGITISKEQVKLGGQLCKGLDVEFKLMDYRQAQGKFDRVVSIAMFEAVGFKNFRVFMNKVHECLLDNGLFFLHTIGNRTTKFSPDPWLNKYIFPNGILPSIRQIAEASEDLFVLEDLHNFGADYDKTLMAWFKNFDTSWPKVEKDFDERFYRMWKYYLLSCAALFRARQVQLWQMVFSKRGVLGGYASVR